MGPMRGRRDAPRARERARAAARVEESRALPDGEASRVVPVRTEPGRAESVAAPPERVRVGLCGFSMAIEDYPLRFPVVEIQQTFYQPPRDETLRRWLAATPADFEFTIKAWQLVTHPGSSPTYRRMTRPLDPAEQAACGFFRESSVVAEGYARSLECARVLGATALLFQCPSSFRPENEHVENLRRFFTIGPGAVRPAGIRFLWEPRGARWTSAAAEARDLARKLDLVLVVDPFVTPPDARSPVYWRLHGLGGARNSYSDGQLEDLAGRLAGAPEPPPGPAYVMFNNLPRVGDAMRFRRMIQRGKPVRRREKTQTNR
jgi:uncharacterized protein YecE (DUF72 family)